MTVPENVQDNAVTVTQVAETEEVATAIPTQTEFELVKATPTQSLGFKFIRNADNGSLTVTKVDPGSLADVAGFQPGWTVLTVYGEPAASVNFKEIPAGTVTVLVDTTTTAAPVVVQSDDIEQGGVGPTSSGGTPVLMFELVKANKSDKIGLTTVRYDGGTVKIKAVTPGGLADRAGLKPGMKVLTVNGSPASDVTLSDLDAGKIMFFVADEQPAVVATAAAVQPTVVASSDGSSGNNNGCVAGWVILLIIGLIIFLFLSILIGIVLMVIGGIGLGVTCCKQQNSK